MKKLTGILTGALACSFVFTLPFLGGCNEDEIKNLENKVNTLTSEKSALEKENAGLKTSKSQLENQVTELTSDKNSLISKNNELNTENTALLGAINDLFKTAFDELVIKANASTDSDTKTDFVSKAELYQSYVQRVTTTKLVKLDKVYEVKDTQDNNKTFKIKFNYEASSFWVYIKDSADVEITAINIKWNNADFLEATYYEYQGVGKTNAYIRLTNSTPNYLTGNMSELENSGMSLIVDGINRAQITDDVKIELS